MKKHYKRRFKSKKLNVYWILFLLIIIFLTLSITYSLWCTELKIFSTVTLSGDTKNYYFELPSYWTGSTVYCYIWGSTVENENVVQNANFPGIAMSKVDGTSNVYSYSISKDDPYFDIYDNLIFSTGSHTENRTIDISLSNVASNQIFKIEPYNDSQNIRVYYYSNMSGSTIYAYTWNSAGQDNADWPGITTTKVSASGYEYIVDRSVYENIIFNNGSSKTGDLTLPTETDMTYNGITSSWCRIFYSGNWYAFNINDY